MPSTATRGYGTKFRKTSGTNQTALAQIRDVDGPESEADDIDVSNTQSANRRMEFIAGMVDEGEVSFDLVYAKAQHAIVKGLVGEETNSTYEIELPDRTNTSGTGSILAFTGYCKGLGISAPYKDAVISKAKFKVSGEVTYTPSA